MPAQVMGLELKGVMKPGADADLVLWHDTDDGPRAVRTWVGGRIVYDASGHKDD